jgi:hypothetical protein
LAAVLVQVAVLEVCLAVPTEGPLLVLVVVQAWAVCRVGHRRARCSAGPQLATRKAQGLATALVMQVLVQGAGCLVACPMLTPLLASARLLGVA